MSTSSSGISGRVGRSMTRPNRSDKRRAEPRTVRDFLIDPVRSLLNDVLRQLATPYNPSDKTNPIGQGWWIQAEFGSGKSHLLSVIGALALGDKKVWDIVLDLETKNKKGKRESIYNFYENGLAKKSSGKSKGIFVAVKTLVGQGGGTIGVTDTGRKLTEYILDAVQDQYHAETGQDDLGLPRGSPRRPLRVGAGPLPQASGEVPQRPKVLRRQRAGRDRQVPRQPAEQQEAHGAA